MQITFDTTTITDDEVRGIFALLDTVRPSALAVGEPEWAGVQITKRADTGEEVSREPIPTAEGPVRDDSPLESAEPTENTPERDANGLPWDERIHSGSKALNADGTWRTKRGVDKALVASVEAELRTPTASDEQGVSAVFQEDIVVPISTPVPPAPPAPEAPPPAPSSAVSPFVALMKRVTTAQGAGKLTQPRVKELLESLDKKSIMDLRTDEDALASFAVLLDGEGV